MGSGGESAGSVNHAAAPAPSHRATGPVAHRSRTGRERRSLYVMIGMINSAMMFATLIIGLIAGPEVSL